VNSAKNIEILNIEDPVVNNKFIHFPQFRKGGRGFWWVGAIKP